MEVICLEKEREREREVKDEAYIFVCLLRVLVRLVVQWVEKEKNLLF